MHHSEEFLIFTMHPQQGRLYILKTIVLTGGGTAGHVTPNLALIPRLKADGWEIHYIGAADSAESPADKHRSRSGGRRRD